MTRVCAVLILFAAVATADDLPKLLSPAAKLEALQKEQTDAQAAFLKAAEAIYDTPAGRTKYDELWKAFDKGQADRFTAALEMAKSDPKSDFALSALEWVLTIPRAYHLPAGLGAMELVTQHHASNPKVGKIAAWVGYYPPHHLSRPKENATAMIMLKTIAEKNPDRTARGQAVMAAAWEAGRKFAAAESRRAKDTETLATAAETAFERVVKDYGDCSRLMRDGQRTLGEEAKQELFELHSLRVGKVAPELEGADLDGVKFKLSDTRGKVTVVVFWASWCGPCMAMVPHERKLVGRLKDKPFVMVGVNGDDDRAKAKEVTAKESMTWRSFWNGDKGPDGPISRAWNVRGWPTVYVLDPAGVIRFKHLRGEDLDKAVDQLLGELEKK
jgi:thiol-disulfide isomerase/thioredoxin